VAFFCNPASGGTFSSTAIEIIKWVEKIAVAQAEVTHILRPGKASEKTPKGVIPLSLCEILQNASREKKRQFLAQKKVEKRCFFYRTSAIELCANPSESPASCYLEGI
jgi:hypothetical protein